MKQRGFLFFVYLIGIGLASLCASAEQVQKQESDELFPVQVQQGNTWTYTDKTGQPVIKLQPHVYEAYSFSDGRARVRIGSKFGYIDRTGRMVIQPRFDEAYDFSEGFARVTFGAVMIPELMGVFKAGYIDTTGKVAIKPRFFFVYVGGELETLQDFSEGLAGIRISNKWGYLDKTGKTAIEPKFEEAKPFSQGLAIVRLRGKYGYIDKSGEIVIRPQFDKAWSFSPQGLASVQIGQEIKFIDRTGMAVRVFKDESGNYIWQPKK